MGVETEQTDETYDLIATNSLTQGVFIILAILGVATSIYVPYRFVYSLCSKQAEYTEIYAPEL